MTMKKFNVFILDDDKDFCGLLLDIMKQEFFGSAFGDYKLDLAVHWDTNTFDKAVKYIQDNKPDLVLLDYMLGVTPESCLSSLEILKKIIPYCPDIKLVTGLFPEDIRLALAEKALSTISVDIIQKPFSTGDFIEIIRGSIRKKEDA